MYCIFKLQKVLSISKCHLHTSSLLSVVKWCCFGAEQSNQMSSWFFSSSDYQYDNIVDAIKLWSFLTSDENKAHLDKHDMLKDNDTDMC